MIRFVFFFVVIMMTSCSGPRTLFEGPGTLISTDSLFQKNFQVKAPLLKAGDKITISIWGHESLSIGSVNSVYSSNEETGKWIALDDDGEVNLPKIGRVRLKGYNIREANYYLEQQYSVHLKDPIINVKVLNHYVTILGEVKNPGKYALDNEAISLMQMIGMASGLSQYAKSEAVELIRQIDGKSIKYQFNLTELTGMKYGTIILQPDDIVHVGPTQNKQFNRKIEKAAPIVSILTGIAVLISVFVK